MGGFEAVVTRGAFKNREDSHVAAEEKTIRNVEAALARLTADVRPDSAKIAELKIELRDAKGRLVKYKAAQAKVEKAKAK